MRLLTPVLSLCLLAINSPSSSANTQDRFRIAAEDAAQPSRPALRSCSANSADRTQSCNVTCPEGKHATCTGGAHDAPGSDVDCTCK